MEKKKERKKNFNIRGKKFCIVLRAKKLEAIALKNILFTSMRILRKRFFSIDTNVYEYPEESIKKKTNLHFYLSNFVKFK